MAARKSQPEPGKVDQMVWIHLAKLRNLAKGVDAQTGKQMNQSIDRIIAILSGEACSQEPEAPELLAKVAAVIAA